MQKSSGSGAKYLRGPTAPSSLADGQKKSKAERDRSSIEYQEEWIKLGQRVRSTRDFKDNTIAPIIPTSFSLEQLAKR